MNDKLSAYLKKTFLFVNISALIQAAVLTYLLILIACYAILAADYFFNETILYYLKTYFEYILSCYFIAGIALILKTVNFVDYEKLIILIENSIPELKYKLSAVYSSVNSNINNAFSRELTAEIIVIFENMNYCAYKKITAKILKFSLIICGICIILQFMLFNIFRNNINVFFERYYRFNSIHINQTVFRIEPNNVIVLKGGNVKINIRAAGASSNKPPYIILLKKHGIEKQPLNYSDTQSNQYNHTFNNVFEDFEFYIENEFSKSRNYKVKTYILPHLQIENIAVIAPEYTGLAVEYFYSQPEKLTVYKNSIIQLKCALNFDAEKISVLFNKKEYPAVKHTDRIYNFEITASSADTLKFIYETSQATEKPEFQPLKIELIIDAPPTVKFIFPDKDDMMLTEDMLVPFAIYATDDFGISAGKLYIKTANKSETITLDFKGVGTIFEAYYTFDFSKIDLLPGDEISYYAEVFDNDKSAGYKKTATGIHKLRMPTMIDIFNNLNKELEKSGTVFDSLKKKNEELIKTTQRAVEDLIRKGEADWSTQKQIKELIDSQRKIAEEIKKIQENIERAISEHIKARNMLGQETIEKIQKLQSLMSELANSDINKSLAKFENAFNAKTAKERIDNLNAAVFDKQQFNDKLDRTISLLSKMKFQNLMSNLQKAATEILKAQTKIGEQINNEDFKSAADRQQLANNELQKMQNNLAELSENQEAEKMREQIDALQNALKTLKEKAEMLADALKKQKSAANQNTAAKDEIKKMSRSLNSDIEQLAKNINNMMSQLTNMEFEKYKLELDEIIMKMISLQNSNINFKNIVSEQLKKINNPYISGEDNEISKYIGLIENYQNYVFFQSSKYFSLTTKSFIFDPLIVHDFKNISDGYSSIKKNMTNNKNLKNVEIQTQTVMRQNSELIFKLLKIKEALNQDNDSANSDGMANRLEQLAAAQQALNSMAFNMDNLTFEQMQQMAYEQSLIRQGLEQMMESNRGAGDALKKKLEELVKEMNRIEQELKKGRNTAEVKETQKSVYDKLIDSARSLKKDSESKEREGRTATQIQPRRRIIHESYKSRIPKEIHNFMDNQIPREYDKELNEYYNLLLKLYAD